MSPPWPAQRVAVLVDTDNLYHAARRLHGRRIDYGRLLAHVVGGRALARALAYVLRAEDVDVRPFLEVLAQVGFELRVKTAWRTPEGGSRAAWHVGLALEAAALASKVDVVVLVAGDGAYADLGAVVRAAGARLEVAAVPGSVAEALAQGADEVRTLDDPSLWRPERPIA